MHILIAALIALSFTVAACADTTTTTDKPKKTKTAKATPEPVTAYDEAILTTSEKQIKRQMRSIAAKSDATVEYLVSHCIADSKRNYTCESSVTMRLEGGYCGEIDSTQRGNVDPNGDYTWKNTSTDSSGLEPCL